MDMKIRRRVWKKRRRRRELRRRIIIAVGMLLLMAAIILGGMYWMSKKGNQNTSPGPSGIPGIENHIDENAAKEPTLEYEPNQESGNGEDPLDTGKNSPQGDVDKETESTNKEEDGKGKDGKGKDGKGEDEKGEDGKDEDNKEEVVGEDTGTEFYEADESYFDDVLFIGDSRTAGFEMYSGLNNATFFADKGIDVNNIYEKTPIKQKGKNVTILEALKGKTFGKIYIMLGVNELGWVYDSIFIEKYSKLIDDIQQIQPKAKIVIESIIHVTKEKSDADKIYTNKIINSRNKLIKKMAEDKKIYYLDVNEVLTDKDGSLYADASKDGIHLNKQYCLILKEFLMKNTIK
ncbi:hypothetical protein acsn021_35330 [Anaerocolumna cellulosilytica]|uniref:SGNH hydrolase-type esterase domain-containing protein n=1 Tax=Anaerocolumna cellulosilytica TaxID=433286 RepID=A0A6S6QZ88_9FIRM|nr:GDSL-type esterase/lipase family protein [Anaerocolumna cellulosilytica]MBB5195432.1 lysophospholipase L1-like esterase [Anaerocolumna cellulosilytica]BCJ95964.1 hypothetical protein acsn021_35330 [Anaerocolumna cellulosilytica]